MTYKELSKILYSQFVTDSLTGRSRALCSAIDDDHLGVGAAVNPGQPGERGELPARGVRHHPGQDSGEPAGQHETNLHQPEK